MEKKPRKSLRLSRETLVHLEAQTLENVVGQGAVAIDPDDRLTGDTCLCMTYDPCNP